MKPMLGMCVWMSVMSLAFMLVSVFFEDTQRIAFYMGAAAMGTILSIMAALFVSIERPVQPKQEVKVK